MKIHIKQFLANMVNSQLKLGVRAPNHSRARRPNFSWECDKVILNLFLATLIISFTISLETACADDRVSLKYLFSVDGFSKEQKFAAPMGVFYDKDHDEIYVADTGNNQVDVFDVEGQPLFQLTATYELKTPIDVAVSPSGQIYISQMGKNYLEIFDFRGNHLADLYAPDHATIKPGRICFDSDGRFYMSDREGGKILVYDAEGNFQFQFGGKGEGNGKFYLISGIDVDSSGRIYVSDSMQIPVQVFDRNGNFLSSYGSRGPRESEFSLPGSIYIDKKDRIWIVDTFRHHIKVFGTNGELLFQLGTYGISESQLFFPIDIALDEERGRIYILEKGANRLKAFEISTQPK